MIYIAEAFNGLFPSLRSQLGGSHKQLVDLLSEEYETTVLSLRPKKWHWKMRFLFFNEVMV